MPKKWHTCKTVDEVCEWLKKGKYVFTYVVLKNGNGYQFINAYHLCDYGLEAFSIDRTTHQMPLKLKRAAVHFAENIDCLDEKVKEHITMRFKRFTGFVVCDAMLDLGSIGKPTRFKAFPDTVQT